MNHRSSLFAGLLLLSAPVPRNAHAEEIAAAPAQAPAHIDLTSKDPSVRFHLEPADNSPGHLPFVDREVPCNVPCTTTVPRGAYRVGLRRGKGAPEFAPDLVTFTGNGELRGVYKSRRGEHDGGTALVVLGSIATAVSILGFVAVAAGEGMSAALASQACDTTDPSRTPCPPAAKSSPTGAFVALGILGGIGVSGIIGGGVLLATHDSVSVTFVPGTPPSAHSPVGSHAATSAAAFDPLGGSLLVRF